MKIRTIIIICVLLFSVFAGIVIILFNSVSNDPIDKIAISYIRQNTDLQDKYGELIWIGKNVLYETQEDDTMIKSPYTVEIKSGRVIVYVTLIKNDDKWKAVSLEEIEVIPNEN